MIFNRMYFIRILILIGFFLTGMKKSSNNFNSQQPEPIITIGSGLGTLIPSRSVRKDVTSIYGKGEKQNRWDHFGSKSFKYSAFVYEEKGLEFSYYDKIFPCRDILNYISITSPCRYKTSDGLSVGSTKQKVLNSLGKPKYDKCTKTKQGDFYHYVIYDKAQFTFEGRDTLKYSTENDIVTEIFLW